MIIKYYVFWIYTVLPASVNQIYLVLIFKYFLLKKKKNSFATSLNIAIFTESAPRPLQSIICNVCLSVCVFVSSVSDRNQESWRLLVNERTAKVTKIRTPFIGRFQPLFWFLIFFVLWGSFLVNQPIVHSRGVSRGSVCGTWPYFFYFNFLLLMFLSQIVRFIALRRFECTLVKSGQVWKIRYIFLQMLQIWSFGDRCQTLSCFLCNIFQNNWICFKIRKEEKKKKKIAICSR